MAEQNGPQTPQVGVVGQPGQPAQPQPAQGVPGVQGPPVPSAEQIAKVMAEQQRSTQQQIAEARKRAGYSTANGQPQPTQQSNNRFTQSAPQAQQAAPPQPNQAYSQIPENIAASMPPNMRPQQQQQPPAAAPSPVSGMTAEQVLAGPPRQQQYAPQPQQQYAPQPTPQQGGQFAQYAQQQDTVKEEVPWFPVRGAKDSVDIELTDVILKNVPSKGMIGESNAGAKVVLALFSEILALRDKVEWLLQNSNQVQLPPGLEQLPGRVYNLETTLFEQRNALNQAARGVREQIAMAQARGLSPEQILASLSGQQVAAAQMVQQGNLPPAQHTTAERQAAAQADMVAAGTGQAPESQQVAALENQETGE
jgi:hypothetical protein